MSGVVIDGAGPNGVATAHLLARDGIEVAPSTSRAPFAS